MIEIHLVLNRNDKSN